MINLETLANFFWRLEEKYNLIVYEIDGIKVWQYQRFRIFTELAQAVGLYKRAHTKKTGFKDLLKASPSLFYYSIISNPLSGSYEKDMLIFNTGRKVNVDGKLIDIYTKYFIEEEKLENYEIIEELHENIHLTHERENRKHQDYQQIRTIVKSYFSSFRFNEGESGFIRQINNEINDELKIDFNLFHLLRLAYLYFKFDFEFYVKLLKKRKPQKIIIVCAYTFKKALVAAAKNCNVESIELQHGTIDRFHMGYSYPKHQEIDYFPDKMYVFGQYWKDHIRLPLKDENIIIKGFPYFNAISKKYFQQNKTKNQIAILSQGTIGLRISELFTKSANLFKSYTVKYKLHPGEYARWESDYQDLVNIGKYSNVEIIDNNETNLYEYLSKSEYVVGVYSTAVYEALAFGCKVILLDLPGVEYMSELIQNKYVGFAKDFLEVHEQIEKNSFKDFPVDYFFKKPN
ncbi:MAG: hypothetical protein R2757_07000 [Draconibacterium sp.]